VDESAIFPAIKFMHQSLDKLADHSDSAQIIQRFVDRVTASSSRLLKNSLRGSEAGKG
jgi:hypothetical protein